MPHIVVAEPIHRDGIERLLTAPGVSLDHPGKPSNDFLAGKPDRDAIVNAEVLASDV